MPKHHHQQQHQQRLASHQENRRKASSSVTTRTGTTRTPARTVTTTLSSFSSLAVRYYCMLLLFTTTLPFSLLQRNPRTSKTRGFAAAMTMWANNNHNHDSDSPNSAAQISSAASSRLVYGKDDMLFNCIEETQGNVAFGNVLDAGTGMHSLRWIATLTNERSGKGMTSFTAITADKTMQQNVLKEANELGISNIGNVIIGNWFGSTPLKLVENSYDVILADYLIGAMDGFSPYQQDLMIPKLLKLLKPNGRLYIVGLQPIPDKVDEDGDIICQVRRIRDACILLAGHRCYREYPLEWIERQIQQTSYNDVQDNEEESGENNGNDYQFKLLSSKTFSILYKHSSIVTQINVGRSKFKYFPTPELVDSMKTILDDLERQSSEATSKAPNGRIKLGFDYVVAAEKVESTTRRNVEQQ